MSVSVYASSQARNLGPGPKAWRGAKGRKGWTAVGLAVGGALALAALDNHRRARESERRAPPMGRFVTVRGVRLHYVERGQGHPLVLLHGNGSMIQDFESSGLIDEAARSFRVIAFDRPGFGHSARPRGVLWTPAAQADLLHEALERIGVESAVVFGHSWGASVAMALALRHSPSVEALVLASGYYYPSVRADVVPLSAPAIPVLGDILRHTVSPVIGRIIWPLLMRRLFGPAPVPEKFAGFPVEMALRPSQLRASGEETAMMIPDAFAYRGDYRDLDLPVVVVAGAGDRLIDPNDQSARLHGEVANSTFHVVPGAGHMVHQTNTTSVMAAILEAARRTYER